MQCEDGAPAVPPLLTNLRKYIWLRMTHISLQACFQQQGGGRGVGGSSKAAPWELVKGLDTKYQVPPTTHSPPPSPPPPPPSSWPRTPVLDIEAQRD